MTSYIALVFYLGEKKQELKKLHEAIGFDGQNDMQRFRQQLPLVADFVDLPQFRRFRIKERIHSIDFSSVSTNFRYSHFYSGK